ncbi:MAG: hypothetical protein ACK57V_05015 [Pirellula sp.]
MLYPNLGRIVPEIRVSCRYVLLRNDEVRDADSGKVMEQQWQSIAYPYGSLGSRIQVIELSHPFAPSHRQNLENYSGIFRTGSTIRG